MRKTSNKNCPCMGMKSVCYNRIILLCDNTDTIPDMMFDTGNTIPDIMFENKQTVIRITVKVGICLDQFKKVK